jgi:hypothetical protein
MSQKRLWNTVIDLTLPPNPIQRLLVLIWWYEDRPVQVNEAGPESPRTVKAGGPAA